MDTELSEKLKEEQNIYFKASSKISENEKRLRLITADEHSLEYLKQPFKFIVGLIEFIIIIPMLVGIGGFIFSDIGWDGVLGPFIVCGIFLLIIERIVKSLTKKKLTYTNNKLEKTLNICRVRLQNLFELLSPEIHHLGLFDIESVKNKTSARLLTIEFIQKFIIDLELKEGRIEKIQFKDQKSGQEQTLYKSLINHDKDDDMEHIELQID